MVPVNFSVRIKADRNLVVIDFSLLHFDSCGHVVQEHAVAVLVADTVMVLLFHFSSDVLPAESSAGCEAYIFVLNVGVEVFHRHLISAATLGLVAEFTL